MSSELIDDLNTRLASSFAQRATFWRHLRVPIIPVQPRSKACTLKNWPEKATTEECQIAQWNRENPAYNLGAVAKPHLGCTFDGDHESIFERIRLETGKELPLTLSSQGSKDFPLGHYHFLQTDFSRRLGNRELNLKDERGVDVKDAKGKKIRLFDFQQNNKYVVEAGSVHPDGYLYRIVNNVARVPIPDWFCEWMESVTVGVPQSQSATDSSSATSTVAQVAARILTRNLSNNTEEANRLLSQSMGFEHRHQADEKFAIWLVRDSGFGSAERREKFESYKLHEDRSGQYTVKTLEKAERFVADKQAKPKRKLFLKVGSMATVENKQLKWLKRHIILAAALNLLVGDPDVGKTLVAIFYIAELSRSGKKIIIICREDDYSSMWKPRLVVAGANLENIHPVFFVGVEGSEEEIPWMLDDAAHLELLEETVLSYKAALCYIDPLADFAGNLNLSLSGDVRKITSALDAIAKRTGAAVLVACHTTKALVDSGIKTASGSFQLMAAVQSSWLLIEDSDVKGQRLMLQGRNKSGKKRGFKYCVESRPWPSAECGAEDLGPGEQSDGVGLVVFKGDTDKDANDILQRKLDKDEPKNKQIRKWLNELLARGPVPNHQCNDEAKIRGFSRDYVSQVCTQEGVVRNGKTWALPEVKEQCRENQLGIAGGE
jgi:DNA polymerase III delta prime subunit